ncbi:MAG TPA: potassium channel family protein [Terriglobales bacterium]|nr:potassium channel family protein [Terriglobales bacterium]
MHWWASIAGIVLIFVILMDAFETVVLPRRINRSFFRISSAFYKKTWRLWTRVGRHIKAANRREAFLAYFGPLSVFPLLGFWALGLILGFACVQYGLGEHLTLANEKITFGKVVYLSGETFFTLGYGDITPNNTAARALAVMEAGMGFAFLGVVIGYLPVIYNSFAARETEISLLDARAGSPPSAAEFLGRLGCCPEQTVLDEIFRDWERWSADLLSSHISYPVLVYFRSQHGNQSWLSALTVILDVTSLVMTGVEGIHPDQAKLTFAMARHAAVDLAQVVNAEYSPHDADRLGAADLTRLLTELAGRGVSLRVTPSVTPGVSPNVAPNDDTDSPDRLAELRILYEPYLHSLSRRLLMTLPSWIPADRKKDNWQGGPWDRAIQARALEHPGRAADDHF